MHFMVDYETLDTAPSTILISAGAVLFDTDKIIESKYWEFDIKSQIAEGRTFSEDTLRWWFSQGPQAQKPLQPKSYEERADHYTIKSYLHSQQYWIEGHLKERKNNWKGLSIWSNGANFDEPILADLYRSSGFDIPYMFWNVVCFRTFDKLTKCRELVKRQGTHHNAEDDARFQAEAVIAYYQRKKKK